MKSLKLVLVVLVLLLAIAVGYGYGCGSDDGSSSGDDTTTAADSSGANNDGSTDKGEAGGDGAVAGESDSGEVNGKVDDAENGDREKGGLGGGDGGPAAGGPMSRAALIKAGDKICQEVPTRYGELLEDLQAEYRKEGKKSRPPAAEVNMKAAIPPLPEAAQELEELIPPQGDEQQLEDIVTALRTAQKGLEEKPASPLLGPKSPFAEFQKLTKEYGFKVCSLL